MTLMFHGTPFANMNADVSKFVDIYLERKELLEENDMEVVFVGSNSVIKKGISLGKTLHSSGEKRVFFLEGQQTEEGIFKHFQTVSWPRDAFQVFDKKIYICPEYKGITEPFIKRLNMQNSQLEYSIIGEGGMHVRAGEKIVHLDFEELEWSALKNHDSKILTLPTPRPFTNKLESELVTIIENTGHIDPLVNFFEDKKGLTHMVMIKLYYEAFKNQLLPIIDKNFASYFVVKDKKEFESAPTNFVQLPNGKVMIPKTARRTVDYMADKLGEDMVLAVKTLPFETADYQGLRCRTNIVPNKAVKLTKK